MCYTNGPLDVPDKCFPESGNCDNECLPILPHKVLTSAEKEFIYDATVSSDVVTHVYKVGDHCTDTWNIDDAGNAKTCEVAGNLQICKVT